MCGCLYENENVIIMGVCMHLLLSVYVCESVYVHVYSACILCFAG